MGLLTFLPCHQIPTQPQVQLCPNLVHHSNSVSWCPSAAARPGGRTWCPRWAWPSGRWRGRPPGAGGRPRRSPSPSPRRTRPSRELHEIFLDCGNILILCFENSKYIFFCIFQSTSKTATLAQYL